MEKLDLTPDNLIRVGVTPDLLYDKPAFFDFIENNENTFIDFENNFIYTNLSDPYNSDLSFLKSFFENENDYIEFRTLINEKTEVSFREVLNHLPQVNKKEFLINSLPTLFDKVKKAKKVLFDIMLNEITGTKDLKAKDYKKEVWFFVGLWIATGELENLLIEHKNPTQLSKKLYPLQWSSYKTYIGDSRRGDKKILRNTNIFNDDDKITKLYNHCIENNLKIVKSFEDFYNKIER